ncbi:FCD domain-containing protein, partial [Klebsiella pneumoniae]|nr:FCD domain-containing protein [Klebsiella pneumoniae]
GPAMLADLRARVAGMEEAAARGEADRYYRLNLDFHGALFAHAAHRRTADLYAALLRENHLARRLALRRSENMRDSNAEHAAMVGAITAGQP